LGYLEKDKRQGMKFETFENEMDIVGRAVTDTLNETASDLSRAAVSAALVEILTDVLVTGIPGSKDTDIPEKWVFDMMRALIKAKRHERDNVTIN
jgi:hypothetical protein